MRRTEGNEFTWFEWDEAKRATNLRKHRVDFQDLIPALTEPHLVKPSSRPEDDAEAVAEYCAARRANPCRGVHNKKGRMPHHIGAAGEQE